MIEMTERNGAVWNEPADDPDPDPTPRTDHNGLTERSGLALVLGSQSRSSVGAGLRLRAPKYVVAADASPDDVDLPRALFLSIGERCSAVRCPRHLKDPVVSSDRLHAQAAPRCPAMLQILDEMRDCGKERLL